MLQTTNVPEASTPLFRERLLPGPSWWLVIAALVAMIAIAYGAALGELIGLIVAVGLGLLSIVALVRTSPVIEVFDTYVRCGRAQVPRVSCGDSQVVSSEDMPEARRGRDPIAGDRVYQIVPPWLGRTGVLIHLDDHEDPHTAWLVATRRPQALVGALSTRVAD